MNNVIHKIPPVMSTITVLKILVQLFCFYSVVYYQSNKMKKMFHVSDASANISYTNAGGESWLPLALIKIIWLSFLFGPGIHSAF